MEAGKPVELLGEVSCRKGAHFGEVAHRSKPIDAVSSLVSIVCVTSRTEILHGTSIPSEALGAPRILAPVLAERWDNSNDDPASLGLNALVVSRDRPTWPRND